MRELVKSFFSFSWAMSLFGVRELGRLVGALGSEREGRAAAEELDAVTGTARRALGEELDRLYESGDRMQREMVDAMSGGAPGGGARPGGGPPGGAPPGSPGAPPGGAPPGPGGPSPPRPAAPEPPPPRVPAPSGRLDASSFVVLGEGLAAGMADFSLRADWQRTSFPEQMAERMGVDLPQPLIEGPGLGDAPGFQRLPVRVPATMQRTLLERFPPGRPARNLSLPGLTLEDALELRPEPPLVRRDDAKRTLVNVVLGLPGLLEGGGGRTWPTPAEAVAERNPTFVLVELGYAEALAAAVAGDPARLPQRGSFGEGYDRLLRDLRATGAEVLATTVPDPLDTAYFSTLDSAAESVRVAAGDLAAHWGLPHDGLLTLHGLDAIAFQIRAGRREELPEGSVLAAEAARRIRDGIADLNAEIAARAAAHGAELFDLHALWRSVAETGVDAGSRRLTPSYLGGFYSLDGYYPGATGQAVVAHEILALLNQVYGARFPGIDLGAVAATDPAATCRPATGPFWPRERLPGDGSPGPGSRAAAAGAGRRNDRRGGESSSGTGFKEEELVATKEAPPGPLELPPGLVQTLPLSRAASYFGDGIRPVNCRDPQTAAWGSCGELLFSGLAMVDSHLSGELTIRFEPPVDGMSRFELDFGDGFAGEDAVLVTPHLFRMPFTHNRVDPAPGAVSSGTVDLASGMVMPDLTVSASYRSTALLALVGVNPHFPRVPVAFPGPYGSSWAKFEQRSDGLLDFTFYGSTFVPLGPPTVWPMNFAGADGTSATIPAAGTAMHPHLALSTKEPEAPASATVPELPENTIREYTLFTHNSSFGDKFDLHVSDLGGEATGRSHLMGRLEIQFGARTGDAVPIAVSSLVPGGLLAALPADSPLTQNFPGRLYGGPLGYNEFLRFPLRTYYLDSVYILDDPFDLSVSLVDVRTGRSVGESLHRGFIGQDLIFALLRVEPRTPKDSFFFRGPAMFERSPGGGTVFRFKGEVYVPYPGGFLFPQPDLQSGFVVEGQSKLDPFYWLHAIDDPEGGAGKEGGAEDVLGSNGERFSYRYRIPADPAAEEPSFAYENHTQQGSFTLERLTWFDFSRARSAERAPDTVSFTCWGTWRKDGIESRQQASVQVSTAPGAPFVGIQVGEGAVSNVNTKPADIADALP